MARLIVVAIRLIVPLSILRWPIAGGIASMIADALDVVLVDVLAGLLGEPPEFGPSYSGLDKLLDTYYLAFELYVALRWQDAMLRWTAVGLFIWRFIGVVLLEVTGQRQWLLVFPNLFENFYLYIAVTMRFAPRLVPKTLARLALVLVVLLVPKEIQEYVLHYAQFHPWQWVRDTIIGPLIGR
jgi:hypothetical protein